MTVLSIIFGVLLVICGFSCMFTPLATFLSTGYFLCILLLVYGILGIVRFFQKQAGVLELIVSILAVIGGVICLVRPGQSLIFDSFVLMLIAAWLLVQGVVSIIVAFQARGESKGWYWGLIVGILGIIAGLYSFAHPVLTAVTAGELNGFYFIQSGFDMIVLGSAVGAAKKEIKASMKQDSK